MIITAAPAPGTDLSDIHVGDTITIDAFASSGDPGEHFLSFGGSNGMHLFWSSFDMQLVSFNFTKAAFNDLTTDPLVDVATFLAVNPSTQSVFFGWPVCTGLPSSTVGCAVTNLGASRPADSNHVDFTILAAVPEPGSLALLGAALLALGLMQIRGRRNET